MNIKIRSLSLVVAIAAIVPFASAQVAGAVNPTIAAPTVVGQVPTAQPASPAQAAAAQQSAAALQSAQAANNPAAINTNVGASNAANVAAQSSAATMNTTNGITSAPAVQIDQSYRNATVGASGTINTSASGQSNGLGVNGSVSRDYSSSLNTADTVRDIRNASDANRETVINQVDARREASAKEVAEMRNAARNFKDNDRTRFDSAYSQVRSREAALRRSLREARSASGPAAADAQARLAADYEAYNQAVAEAHAASLVNGSVNR